MLKARLSSAMSELEANWGFRALHAPHHDLWITSMIGLWLWKKRTGVKNVSRCKLGVPVFNSDSSQTQLAIYKELPDKKPTICHLSVRIDNCGHVDMTKEKLSKIAWRQQLSLYRKKTRCCTTWGFYLANSYPQGLRGKVPSHFVAAAAFASSNVFQSMELPQPEDKHWESREEKAVTLMSCSERVFSNDNEGKEKFEVDNCVNEK